MAAVGLPGVYSPIDPVHSVRDAVFHDARENGIELLLLILAFIIWYCGMTGRVGAFLGASISPGSMVEN